MEREVRTSETLSEDATESNSEVRGVNENPGNFDSAPHLHDAEERSDRTSIPARSTSGRLPGHRFLDVGTINRIVAAGQRRRHAS